MHQPKSLEKIKDDMVAGAVAQTHPMEMTRVEDIRLICGRLQSLESDHWCRVWSDFAQPFSEKASELEKAGKSLEAREHYMLAYNYYRMARFPVPNTPAKQIAYRQSVENYGKASRFFEPSLEKVLIPFRGRAGEGLQIPAYLRKPIGVERPPVLINHAGVDVFKEEQCLFEDMFLSRGIATLSMDMVGTGECPIIGSLDAERIYDPIFRYLMDRADLDGSRIALMGMSFGGYWATKIAHLDHRLSAAVCWGGGVHYTFQPDWQVKCRYAPTHLGNEDLIVTRSHSFRIFNWDDWLAFVPALSLITQEILDRPCVPLLLVNGKDDAHVPIADYYLLLEHGSPKTARITPGGHMGIMSVSAPAIAAWVQGQLTRGASSVGHAAH
jgi:esterase FrsA